MTDAEQHGVANSPGVDFAPDGEYSYATSFPQPIVIGAAFNDDLVNRIATVVSTEARAFNNVNRSGLDYWTPNINEVSDPRWGRSQEVPGEDPFHISSYVKALVNGLQGGHDPPIKKLVATCKHFAAYDLENWNGITRYGFDAQVTTQDLAEFYLPAFQACARDAKVGSVNPSLQYVPFTIYVITGRLCARTMLLTECPHARTVICFKISSAITGTGPPTTIILHPTAMQFRTYMLLMDIGTPAKRPPQQL